MTDPKQREWMRTLGEIDESIQNCLASLERYELKFTELLAPRPPGEAESPREAVEPLPSDTITSQLNSVEDATASVERLIEEQETVWNEWRQRFATWKSSLAAARIEQAGRTA